MLGATEVKSNYNFPGPRSDMQYDPIPFHEPWKKILEMA